MAYFIPFDLRDIPLRTRIPVSLWNPRGRLLLAGGMRIESEEQRALLIAHNPVIKQMDSELWRSAYLSHLDNLLRNNCKIGEIATALLPTELPDPTRAERIDPYHEVNELVLKTSRLLELSDEQDFHNRATQIAHRLVALSRQQLHVAVLNLLWCLQTATSMQRAIVALLQGMAAVAASQHHPVQAGHASAKAPAADRLVLGLLILARAEARAAESAGRPLTPLQGERPSLGLPDGLDAPEARALLVTTRLWAARLVEDALNQATAFADLERRLYRGLEAGQQPWFQVLQEVFGSHVPGVCVELANTEVAVIARHPRDTQVLRVLSFISPSGNPLQDPVARDVSDARYAIRQTVPLRQIRVRTDPRKFQRT